MPLDVTLVPPEEVRALRDLYRHEMHCQIIHDSWHGRGWVDSYLFRVDGRVGGYSLVGGVRGDPKNTITEFYLLPDRRGFALPLFRRLAAMSGARRVEVQTNDVLFTLMAYDCATRIESPVILFHDAFTTQLTAAAVTFRKVTAADRDQLTDGKLDADAEWLVEADGLAVAAGGLLFHYNVPCGDIYMGVAEPFRRREYGSYLVQELKRTCYEMGRIPAARCNASNAASRATLQRAGMLPCARVLTGELTDDLRQGPARQAGPTRITPE
jgi:GNAT superfamily N-acetyltransferase